MVAARATPPESSFELVNLALFSFFFDTRFGLWTVVSTIFGAISTPVVAAGSAASANVAGATVIDAYFGSATDEATVA